MKDNQQNIVGMQNFKTTGGRTQLKENYINKRHEKQKQKNKKHNKF